MMNKKVISKSTYKKLKFVCISIFIIAVLISILLTLYLYNFITYNKANTILSNNMIDAIRNYNVSIKDILKQKFIYRTIEIAIFIFFILSKFRDKFMILFGAYIGLCTGFFITIFIKEMGYHGIFDLILISFPQRIFYFATIFCIINMVYNNSNLEETISIKYKIFDKIAPYVNIILLWGCGILSEAVINLYLIQRFF